MRKAVVSTLFSMILAASSLFGQAAIPITITVNEHGNGNLFNGGSNTNFAMPGVLAADPGPGGLPSALTYNLLGPPSLVAGDLILIEPGGSVAAVTSDVIRFNPAGTGGAGYPASLVFYSDLFDGIDALADTGFPLAFYGNTLTVTEVGPEGSNGFTYIPTAGQPGFIAGFAVTYNIISDDAVPEPASATLFAIAGAAMLALRRRAVAKASSR